MGGAVRARRAAGGVHGPRSAGGAASVSARGAYADGDSQLKSQGFAKLVRRDKGVYENVTALDGEKRFVTADDPSSMPDLKRRNMD